MQMKTCTVCGWELHEAETFDASGHGHETACESCVYQFLKMGEWPEGDGR